MTQRLGEIAKKAAALLMIELLVPGGTLVVLGILLASGILPPLPSGVAALLPCFGSGHGSGVKKSPAAPDATRGIR